MTLLTYEGFEKLHSLAKQKKPLPIGTFHSVMNYLSWLESSDEPLLSRREGWVSREELIRDAKRKASLIIGRIHRG